MMLDIVYFGGWLGDPERPLRQRRPADPLITFRDKRIAAHSMLLEQEELDRCAAQGTHLNLKKVLGSLNDLYSVKRSTIFYARKRWCPKLRSLGYGQTSTEKRRRLIRMLEEGASDPLLR